MRRKNLKRLVWLGMALLGALTIHLVFWRIRPSRRTSFTYSHVPKQNTPITLSHTDTLHTTMDQTSAIVVHGKANNVSHVPSASTTVRPKPEVDKMVVAAARFKTVFIPPTFTFSNDIYFHPPETVPARNLSRFLINPVDTCSASAMSSDGSPFLIVLALSSYLNNGTKERDAIRTTYGSVTKGKQWPNGKSLAAPVRMVFVLGRPPSTRHQKSVAKESAQHGDMLVADFVDSYRNLTLKVLHGLHWALQHCPKAKFVMKADDDVFVNFPLLTAFLVNRGSNNSVCGYAFFQGKVRRTGRWAVSSKAYPISRYPVYLSGTSYVMSMDAAQKIVQASHRLPLIPIEDAFITGILPQITAVRRISCQGFTRFSEKRANDCEFFNDKRMVGNRMHANEKQRLWLTLTTDSLTQTCV